MQGLRVQAQAEGCAEAADGLEAWFAARARRLRGEGQVLTQPAARAPQDRSLRGYRTLARAHPLAARAQADLIIKNTYRTLMTRGMQGCFVYCTDEATRAYLRRGLGLAG